MTVRVYAAGVTAGAGSRSGVRVYAAGMSAFASRVRVYAAGATSYTTAVRPTVAPLDRQTAEAWDTVTIAATADPGADTWVFTVTGGGATLSGTGGTRTFVAPAAYNGVTVTVDVQAIYGGITSAAQTFTCDVDVWSSYILGGPVGVLGYAGGDAFTVPTDTLDGGTATSTPVDIVSGGSSATADFGTAAWEPRRPLVVLAAGGPVDGGSAVSANGAYIDGGTAVTTNTTFIDGGTA